MSNISVTRTLDLVDGREDVECEVEATVSGRYHPERISGPPEDCYPAEFPDIDIRRVKAGDEDVTQLLTPHSQQVAQDAIWNELRTYCDYDNYDYVEDDDGSVDHEDDYDD